MLVKETIVKIAFTENKDHKIELLNFLKENINQLRNKRQKRDLVLLLYDKHWYIRQEAALLIDRLGLKLKDDEYYQYLFALQDFENLFVNLQQKQVRRLIFSALKDPNIRLRSKIFRYLKYEDCETFQERALFWYGCAEYQNLIPIAQESGEAYQFVVDLLTYGMEERNNSNYHRRRCAETLGQLKHSEQLQEFINELQSSSVKPRSRQPVNDLRPVPDVQEYKPDLDCLQFLMADMQEEGLLIDVTPPDFDLLYEQDSRLTRRVYPEIHLGTITNRITYRNPNIQSWTKLDRHHRILAPINKEIIIFDFVATEPTILVHFLLQRFLLSLEDITNDDIYLAFLPQNRHVSKRLLNRIINGGRGKSGTPNNPFAQKLVRGLKVLRMEYMSFARKFGYVETIGGNKIPIDENTENFGGKVINRLIQGSASDIFNYTLCKLKRTAEELQWDIDLFFVIFDEVWLSVPWGKDEEYAEKVGKILNEVYKDFNLLIPLKCKQGIYP